MSNVLWRTHGYRMHCILDSIITIYYILFLGWKKIPYHWCTIQGRKFLSGKKGVKQYFWQCARQCNKIRGCNAVEMWFAYNWNCYWCKRPDLIRPYTNKHDLAYPAHVWVRRKSRLSFGILKLMKYSCSQKPINDDHSGQVNESWQLMKHQSFHLRWNMFFI